jgi:hypothetical protein
MSMNELIRKCERESHIDVYGLGLDRVKWEAALEKFAALVAAYEREECAKVADRQNGDDEEDSESCVWSKAARHIAAAIRARGSK